MLLVCGQCGKTLEYSGEPPAFCGYCGRALADTKVIKPPATPTQVPSTVHIDHEAATLSPATGSRGTGSEIPDTIGRYRLLRRLGAGGMGSVYEAEDTTSQKRVALKLVAPEFLQSADARERFRREGQLASKFHHPRCVFVLGASEEEGRPYIVMELMPGLTLQDLVREKGPLSPQEAIRKILDVLDGLQEVHRAGLVHRDVKPSNCFMESDGRVKIGDFGLAKSLHWDLSLTKSGSFLGTALYAAPEQIKSERVDSQSDLYSAAATLYYLLSGRAPFQDFGDGMATMAAIVSEDPPSLRKAGEQVPAALEKVVLRGLERDRTRRWRSLEQFRQALVRCLPPEPSVAGLGFRLAAYMIDLLIVLPIIYAGLSRVVPDAYLVFVGEVFSILYWGTMEGCWGFTPGKWLLWLRVCSSAGDQPPGIPRGMFRAFVLSVLSNLGSLGAFLGWFPSEESSPLVFLAWLVGAVLIFFTMRRSNGYRGLHEFLSGTRTVILQSPFTPSQSAILRASAYPTALGTHADTPDRVADFVVRGTLRWDLDARVLLAQDPSLERDVWIWFSPASRQPANRLRKDLARETRLRWLASGELAGQPWTAFAAPDGCSLATLMSVENPLSWLETRQLLEDLSRELVAATKDDSLPEVLCPEQVWVRPDGRTLLLDQPFETIASARSSPLAETHVEDPGLEILRQTAILALEGRLRKSGTAWPPIQAPLPVHACEILDRLLGAEPRSSKPYQTVEQLTTDLAETRSNSPVVTRRQRLVHIVLLALFLWLPLGFPLVMTFEILVLPTSITYESEDWDGQKPGVEVPAGMLLITFLFMPGWAFMTRGGIGYWLAGIHPRQRDGRPAARWRCAMQSLLKWLPFLALLALALIFAHDGQRHHWSITLAGAAALVPAGYAGLAIWQPQRSLFERVTGIYLVPG